MKSYLINNFKKVVQFTLLIFILLLVPNKESKALVRDSTEIYITIGKIGHFNPDSTMDTLICVAKSNRKFYPRSIVWGSDTNSLMPNPLKVKETVLSYSSSTISNITPVGNVGKVNADSLLDIVIILRGKLLQPDSTLKDTAIAVVIWGQQGLDTLASIDVMNIARTQDTPFNARHLYHAVDFTDYKVRDMTYNPSVKLRNITLYNTRDPQEPSVVKDEQIKLIVYPNPASNFSQVKIDNIQQGEYIIKIISIEGVVQMSERISVNQERNITKLIDLSNFASGTYFLQIGDNTKVLGKFNISIIH